MKTMKKMITLLAVVGMVLALAPVSSDAANIFTADFEGSSEASADAANLNLGTVGATWTVNDLQEANVTNDDVTNSANQIFNPDNGTYDFDINFTSTPLVGSEFSYDAYQQRSNGNVPGKRANFITGYDSDGDEVFQVILADGAAATSVTPERSRYSYVNSAGTLVTVTDGLYTSGGGAYEDGHFASFRLEFNATDYEIFIGNVSILANAEYRNAVGTGPGEINGLATIRFDTDYRGITGLLDGDARGAFYDNLSLEGVPPPPAGTVFIFK
jgi:hypothetical protein